MSDFRTWLLTSARNEAEKYYDADKILCIIPRETIWYSICLLESEHKPDHELANKILENIQTNDGTHSLGTLVVIWYRYQNILSEKAKLNILNNFFTSFPLSAFTRFNDGNVNHPLGAYCNLICGGEITGKKEISEIGLFYLKEFYKTSTKEHTNYKQTQLSEYMSPTYTSVTIWFLNIIANYSSNSTAKELAKFLEERIWIDVALHFHAPSQQFSGPFSRAYQDDSVGGYSGLHSTMIKAIGKEIYFNPEVSYRYDHPSNFIQNALIAVLDFNLPKDFYEIAFNKIFPLYFKQKTFCEQYFENKSKRINEKQVHVFDDECYPGGWSDLTTYLTNNYSLGTAERQYVNGGHTDVFSFRYKRNEPITDQSDFRCMHTRGVYNDASPGQSNLCHVTGYNITKDFLYEEGRSGIYQHKNKAIVCYFPKRSGNMGVKSFRLDLIFDYYSTFDCIYINDNKIDRFPINFSYNDKIFVEDKDIYFSIIPFRGDSVGNLLNKIWVKDNFIIFSFFSYNGLKNNFTRDEISLLLNGFFFEVSDNKLFDNISDFKKYINSYKIYNNSSKNVLSMKYVNDDASIEIVFDSFRDKVIEKKWKGSEDELNSFYIETEDIELQNQLKNGIFEK